MGSESRFAGWLDRVESVVLSVASLVAFFESGLLEWDCIYGLANTNHWRDY